MIGTTFSNRYLLIDELGRGGMAVVYRAHDLLLDREVALKTVVATGLGEEAVERFQREARLVAQLDHSAIVPIFDFGRHGDFLFFVMPLLQGRTLSRLQREAAIGRPEVLEILAQVAEALDYSASQGVTHRDVTPENVMVAWPRTETLRAWVMDFGLALPDAGSRITKTGKLPGTLAYLSPEHVLSEAMDGRSDIYSLGTILYECLTGQPPFLGAPASVLYRIAHEPPPPLAEHGADPELASLVLQCLAKKPADRPQRGRDLAVALRRILDPASEPPPSGVSSSEEPAPGSPDPPPPPDAEPRPPPFVGREAELAALEHRLEKALAGEGQLVVIGGEPGMGKTRLLEELEGKATAHGVRVLRGRFSAQEKAFPYQGFCELVQDYFRPGGRRDGTGAELHDLAADLLSLFPALGEIDELRRAAAAPREREPEASSRMRLFEALARTFVRLADGRPLVLLLESLHVADVSIELLRFIVRRLAATPTLIVGTYRQTETSRHHPLVRLLRSCADDPSVEAMALAPLSRAEHRQLAAWWIHGDLDDALARRLYEASEGNPFFTRELVQTLTRSGTPAADGARDSTPAAAGRSLSGDLPETIQQVVERRLERLPEEALRILEVASVLGKSFDFADLHALTGESADTDPAVEEMIRQGILEEDRRSRGDRLKFSSGVIRDVVYGALPRRRRRLLHRRYAEWLERRSSDRSGAGGGRTPERIVAQLMHHFSEGDVAAKTVEYALRRARLSLAAFSWEDTVRATRTALYFVDDEELSADALANESTEGQLRALLAAAQRALGHRESALREAERSVRAFERAGEQGGAAGAALLAAEIAWQERRIDLTRHWVGKGTELARQATVPETSSRLLQLGATVANLRGEYAGAQDLLREARSLVSPPEPTQELPAGGTLATVLPSPVTTLDPALFETVEEAEVLANVFEPLLSCDAAGNLLPALAGEWEGEDGGALFRFHLRPEARFSDGEPLSAAAVRRSLERAARCRPHGHSRAAFAAIEGIDELLAGSSDRLEGLRVEDRHRLAVRLRRPLPIFPTFLTEIGTAIVRSTDGGELLGSGPFVLAERHGDRILLARNPNAWHPVPARLDAVELRTSLDASGIASGLRAGDLDLARDLLPEDLERALRDPRLRDGWVETTQKNVYFLCFNLSGPVARHPAVRRALAGVVRPQDLVWRTLGRSAQPAACLIPPGILGHDAGRNRPTSSRARALELLEHAGLGRPLELRAAVHPQLLDRYGALTRALAEEWSALGVEMVITTRSMESYLDAWNDCADIDLLLARWVPAYDDPDAVAGQLFHSQVGHLAGYLGSDHLDPLLEGARQQIDPAVRQSLYRKLEDELAAQHVLLPLFHDVDYRVAGPRVRGLVLRSVPPYVNYAGLGKESDPKAEPRAALGLRDRGTLRIALPTPVASLDPLRAYLVEAAEVVPNVFESLTRITQSAGVVPHLAESVDMEDSGRRARVRLPKGVRFHDGRRLTARDVRYSFERALRAPAPGHQPLRPILGAREFRAGEADEISGLTIVSSTELVLDLERPLSFFPALLTLPSTAIVPEGETDFIGSWRDGCAGTGPFRVVRASPGESIELAANPDYRHRGLPRCERLVFELGLSPQQVLERFRAGRLALASHLRHAELEALKGEPELAAGHRELPGFSTYYLILDPRRDRLADPQVRRALADALDVETLVETCVGQLGITASSLIPPGLLGHEAPAGRRPAAGGHPSLRGLTLTAAVHSAYLGQHAPLWEAITAALADLGVSLEITHQGTETMLAAVSEAAADLVADRWVADYPDPDSFATLFRTGEGLYGDLAGDEIDRLIELGRVERELELRRARYLELESRLADEALVVPLFHEQVIRFARPEVEGLRLRFRLPVVAYEELELAR